VLASLAYIAQNRGYCRPQFSAKRREASGEERAENSASESDELEIIAGGIRCWSSWNLPAAMIVLSPTIFI